MRTYKKELEFIANDLLEQNISRETENKPNYNNREFMNAVIIFETALMDKMWDNVMEFDKISYEERMKMATSCQKELRKLIHTYTSLDIDEFEKFV